MGPNRVVVLPSPLQTRREHAPARKNRCVTSVTADDLGPASPDSQNENPGFIPRSVRIAMADEAMRDKYCGFPEVVGYA